MVGPAPTPGRKRVTGQFRPTPQEWFMDHYAGAAEQIIEFLEQDGISLDGKKVADIGCGEGIIALGLSHRAQIAHLDAYDLRVPSRENLARLARDAGVQREVPAFLDLHRSKPAEIGAPSDYFDVVVSWSAFEHVANPVGLLGEIRRILRPDGVFFLQIWPLFHSEHGGHLWLTQANEPFAHLRSGFSEIAERIDDDEGTYPGFAAHEEWASLNRMSLDDLQRALLAARLIPTKVELLTHLVHLDWELMRYSLSDLTTGGVKLLAIPWGLARDDGDDGEVSDTAH